MIDTIPVVVCDNFRISWSHIYGMEAYRGYYVSKKRYFYGVKVYLMVMASHQAIEFFITPGGTCDVKGV